MKNVFGKLNLLGIFFYIFFGLGVWVASIFFFAGIFSLPVPLNAILIFLITILMLVIFEFYLPKWIIKFFKVFVEKEEIDYSEKKLTLSGIVVATLVAIALFVILFYSFNRLVSLLFPEGYRYLALVSVGIGRVFGVSYLVLFKKLFPFFIEPETEVDWKTK